MRMWIHSTNLQQNRYLIRAASSPELANELRRKVLNTNETQSIFWKLAYKSKKVIAEIWGSLETGVGWIGKSLNVYAFLVVWFIKFCAVASLMWFVELPKTRRHEHKLERTRISIFPWSVLYNSKKKHENPGVWNLCHGYFMVFRPKWPPIAHSAAASVEPGRAGESIGQLRIS